MFSYEYQLSGKSSEIEYCSMYKYKLMSGFIVHCDVKSMYCTLKYCIRELWKLSLASRNGIYLNKNMYL